MKVVKFGGSSMADAGQYRKVRDILMADPERKVVVVSAAGKRFSGDHKLTDLLYLCHAHVEYGVDCSGIFDMIASRYLDIRDELGLNLQLEPELLELKKRLDAKSVTRDELVSRGEYFSAKLMAAYLGFQFVDAADWVKFNLDGSVNQEETYEALRYHVLEGYGAVIPGFYGSMPDGTIHTFSRGGSDITGALAAAALDADVYENWTDVSGILMADPRIVDNPQAIPEVTYDELRELSYSGAQVLHEDSIFPVREKNIPVNIRNTNDPEAPGTMIQGSFEGDHDPDRFITGITGKKDFSIISLSKRATSAWIMCPMALTTSPWCCPPPLWRRIFTPSWRKSRRKRSRTLWMCTTRSPWLPPWAGRWPSVPVFPARSSLRWANPASTSA